jgi:hypothetical protein
VIASEEIAYRETTLPERWTRRMQAEGEDAQLASLQNMTAQDRLSFEREQIAYARKDAQLEAELRQRQLSKQLEEDDEQEDEGISAEQLADNLTVLKSYIDGLKADKQQLINNEGTEEGGTWQEAQELAETITQYEALYRELHGNYTRFKLGIA